MNLILKGEANDLAEELSKNSTTASNNEAKSLLYKVHGFLKKAQKVEDVSYGTLKLFSRLASKVTDALEFLTSYIT